ncbi:hypothetical protein IT072_20915 (plasmid) [Leifsonia sp. ZF2019]|uniref:hypothetical protein n=1 Tax=Leifsonia sp. ZF2019 TaxID=2781978 RepID=UPI001CBEF1BB|nr:hypothetical protein [Leifsonia sp. ZF2019]UAJ81722.1 hypothetical protein IT072_20915 [Leifsonia sp. ZF2019]
MTQTTIAAHPAAAVRDTHAEFAAIIAAENYRVRLTAHQAHTAQVGARYHRAYRVLGGVFGILATATLGLFIAFAITKNDAAATAAYAAAIAAIVFFLAPCLLAAVELHQVQSVPGPRRTR